MNAYKITPLTPAEKQAILECVDEYRAALDYVAHLQSSKVITPEQADALGSRFNDLMWSTYGTVDAIRALRAVIESEVRHGEAL